jgi:hypothetical protein
MNNANLLLFYDEEKQLPADKFRRLPGLHAAGNLTCFGEALENSNLVFLQVGGELRQEAVKLLLKKRKSFALLGLENSDLLDTERLQIAARKKHLQVCWLGSLRFRQAAARLQELLSSGCLGEILHWQFAEAPDSPWTPYQTQDLINWLLPGEKAADSAILQLGNEELSLEIQASNGSAKIQLQKEQTDIFRMKLQQGKEKILACSNDAEASEIGTLLLLHKLNKPWQIMAKP